MKKVNWCYLCFSIFIYPDHFHYFVDCLLFRPSEWPINQNYTKLEKCRCQIVRNCKTVFHFWRRKRESRRFWLVIYLFLNTLMSFSSILCSFSLHTIIICEIICDCEYHQFNNIVCLCLNRWNNNKWWVNLTSSLINANYILLITLHFVTIQLHPWLLLLLHIFKLPLTIFTNLLSSSLPMHQSAIGLLTVVHKNDICTKNRSKILLDK